MVQTFQTLHHHIRFNLALLSELFFLFSAFVFPIPTHTSPSIQVSHTFHPFTLKEERWSFKVYLSVPLPICYHLQPKQWMCTVSISKGHGLDIKISHTEPRMAEAMCMVFTYIKLQCCERVYTM